MLVDVHWRRIVEATKGADKQAGHVRKSTKLGVLCFLVYGKWPVVLNIFFKNMSS